MVPQTHTDYEYALQNGRGNLWTAPYKWIKHSWLAILALSDFLHHNWLRSIFSAFLYLIYFISFSICILLKESSWIVHKENLVCCLRYCKLQSVENTFELVLPLLWEACMARCFYMYDCVCLQVWWCVSVSMALCVCKYDELLPLCRFKYEQGVQVGTLFVLLKPFKRLISKTKYAKLLVFCPSSPP